MNRVLVVDDDGGMRTALEARFLRRGWQVETAASAGEALEKFRRGMHSLIVTDIRMPGRLPSRLADCTPSHMSEGEDGFFVMRAARALCPHTAVILLTAFASVPDAVAAMKDGACDYVPKELSSASLDILHIQKDLIAKIRAAALVRRSHPPAILSKSRRSPPCWNTATQWAWLPRLSR